MWRLQQWSGAAAIAVLSAVVAIPSAERALAEARTILPPQACVVVADAAPVAAFAHYAYVFGAAGRSSPATGEDADLVPVAVRATTPQVEAGAAPPIDSGFGAVRTMRGEESQP